MLKMVHIRKRATATPEATFPKFDESNPPRIRLYV